MKRTLAAILVLLSGTCPLLARARIQGYAGKGGGLITVAGARVTVTSGTFKYAQVSYPNCTVAIYYAGGGIVSSNSVYSDNAGMVKGNPFTADSTGYWFAYLDDGTYDVRFSGTGIASPFTLGDISLRDASPNPSHAVGNLTIHGNIYDNYGNMLFQFNPQASAVNKFQFINGASGNGGSFSLAGGDAKGKLMIGIWGASTQAESNAESGAYINFAGNLDTTVNSILQLVPRENGLNFIRIESAANSGTDFLKSPLLVAVGVSNPTGLRIGTQQLGVISLGANMGNNKILALNSVSSSLEGVDLNHAEFTNATDPAGPILSTAGVGTNINLNLHPKGNGVVNIKTNTALSSPGAISFNESGSGVVYHGFGVDTSHTLSVWSYGSSWAKTLSVKNTGEVGIGTATPTSKLQVVGLPIYANNAAALAGGLTAGAFYRTGADPDVVCVVH
jgi:hypothetical protein